MAEAKTKQPGEKRKLTRAEKAVLAVLVNPDYFKADNAARIEAADVSPSRFYEIVADPWFQEQSKQAFLNIVRGNVGPIIAAAMETASAVGREGHQDRKMLLEMSGLHADKGELKGDLTVTLRDRTIDRLPGSDPDDDATAHDDAD